MTLTTVGLFELCFRHLWRTNVLIEQWEPRAVVGGGILTAEEDGNW